MRRNKTQRKREFETHPLGMVGHPRQAGRWREFLGDPDARLVLELGCGKAQFLLQYARTFPQDWIIGIDVKKERMWRAATTAEEEGLQRVRFLFENILILEQAFGTGEIDELWITFPDPFPKTSHEKHRMTGPNFLASYRRILKPDGIIHFKTDNADLFEYSLTCVLAAPTIIHSLSDDLHANPWLEPKAYFETDYEKKFRAEGIPIRYLKFSFLRR